MKRAPTSKADKADRTAVKHSGDPTHDFVGHADAEAYDAWFRRKVLEGLADARAGKVMSNREVEEYFRQRRAATRANIRINQ